jgi:hypothetical protein
LFLRQLPQRRLQFHRGFFHARRTVEPSVIQPDFARLRAQRIERRIANSAVEIWRRSTGYFNVSAQQPLENLVKHILSGRKGRREGARICEQASPVLLIKPPDVLLVQCGIPPPSLDRHRNRGDLSLRGKKKKGKERLFNVQRSIVILHLRMLRTISC